jgi:hypothetical protein
MRLRSVLAVLLLSCLGGIPSARADYISLSFSALAQEAEVIALGKIVRVDESTYDLDIEQVIALERRLPWIPSRLKVLRFRNWTCAARWSEYKAGQRLLVFLAKDRECDCWAAIGAGNEGEMPVENRRVYTSQVGSVSRSYVVYGSPYLGSAIPLDHAIEAVKHKVEPDPKRVLVDTGDQR